MILEQYKPSAKDTWEWTLARVSDVDEIVALAQGQFQKEIDKFFTPEPMRYATNVIHACVNQSFDKLSEQIIVARNVHGKLLAYAWIQRGQFMPYAPEEIAEARFVHLDLNLSSRTRITLLAQILQQWELWALICGIPVLCSSTIRGHQDAFLKLHEQAGYTLKGSIAFKRL
jgi:predicted trehalose synthase